MSRPMTAHTGPMVSLPMYSRRLSKSAERKISPSSSGIGPVVMMKAVCEVTRPYAIKTVVSLNTIMVDGTGMCGCCRATIGGETKFVCVDGPEFDAHLVDFPELVLRQKMYNREERRALWDHKCKIEAQEKSVKKARKRVENAGTGSRR